MRITLTIAAFALSNLISAQTVNTYTATYNADTLLADMGFVAYPGSSICAGSLSIPVPLGEVIDSVSTSYTFFSSLAGFGGTPLQRSMLYCPTTGMDEGMVTLCGACAPTTETYIRTTNIANGISNGVVIMELHLGTTRLFGGNCNQNDFVAKGTWSVTVYTHSPSTGIADGTAPTPSMLLVGDELRISGLTDPTDLTVELFDVSGRRVATHRAVPSGNTAVCPVPSDLTGIFFARCTVDGVPFQQRFVR